MAVLIKTQSVREGRLHCIFPVGIIQGVNHRKETPAPLQPVIACLQKKPCALDDAEGIIQNLWIMG